MRHRVSLEELSLECGVLCLACCESVPEGLSLDLALELAVSTSLLLNSPEHLAATLLLLSCEFLSLESALPALLCDVVIQCPEALAHREVSRALILGLRERVLEDAGLSIAGSGIDSPDDSVPGVVDQIPEELVLAAGLDKQVPVGARDLLLDTVHGLLDPVKSSGVVSDSGGSSTVSEAAEAAIPES